MTRGPTDAEISSEGAIARDALLAALRETLDSPAFHAPSRYVVDVHDALLAGIDPAAVEAEFGTASGNEFKTHENGTPPKIHAPWSSAALAVNAFWPFRDQPDHLALAGRVGFDVPLRFEATFATGTRGIAHLDLLAQHPGGVIAVESKCTEFLRAKEVTFKPAYAALIKTLPSSPWRALIGAARSDFRVLDVAQLVKHALGLARRYEGQTPVTLLYLYWEPSNAAARPVFDLHRREIAALAELVAGDRAVAFAAQSYPELWETWQRQSTPTWLVTHLAALRARYDVAL